MADYFREDYFAVNYFRQVSPSRTMQAIGIGYRDGDAYSAILTSLKGLGEFARVEFALSEVPPVTAADADPLAVVRPVGWRELDDASSGLRIRLVSFELTLSVREEEAIEGFGRLDRLGDLVQNALDGSTLGGGCEAGLTRLALGSYDPASPHPEHRLRLGGEFAYGIQSGGTST